MYRKIDYEAVVDTTNSGLMVILEITKGLYGSLVYRIYGASVAATVLFHIKAAHTVSHRTLLSQSILPHNPVYNVINNLARSYHRATISSCSLQRKLCKELSQYIQPGQFVDNILDFWLISCFLRLSPQESNRKLHNLGFVPLITLGLVFLLSHCASFAPNLFSLQCLIRD